MLKLIKSFPQLERPFGQDESWGLAIVGCSQRKGRDAARLWNSQSHYALNLILNGTGRLGLENGTVTPLSPGLGYQHIPASKTPARLTWEPGRDVHEWYVILDLRLYSRLHPLGLFPPKPVLRFADIQHASSVFSSFHEHLAPLHHLHGSRRLHSVLAATVHFLGHLSDAIQPAIPAGHWPRVVHEARHQIELHPASREPLPQLARRLGVSYAGLRRAFQNEFGSSMTSYRIARRMDEAKGCLLHSDVSSTALRLGYPDPFTFSSQFKQVTGLSPRDYQRGRFKPQISANEREKASTAP